jgi:hypothetical protein
MDIMGPHTITLLFALSLTAQAQAGPLLGATVDAKTAACTAGLEGAFGGLLIDHPSGAPVLSTNQAMCESFSALPGIDTRCTNFGAARGLVDTELGFFLNSDAEGTYCGCACVGDGSGACLPPAELEGHVADWNETDALSDVDFRVTEKGFITVASLEEVESCDEVDSCALIEEVLGATYVTVEVEDEEGRSCACACDSCGVLNSADVWGAHSWDALDIGTEAQPLYATTAATQLESIAGDVTALSADYLQCTDVDLAGLYAPPSFDELGELTDAGHPYFTIGAGDKPFTGSYDGQGFQVRSFTYRHDEPAFVDPELEPLYSEDGTLLRDDRDHVGLFGRASAAQIRNMQVSEVDIHVEDVKNTGGVVGWLISSTLQNVSVTGAVTALPGSLRTGGLAGEMGFCVVEDVHVDVDVSGGGYVGGLAATASISTVTRAASVGDVSGGSSVAGLISNLIESELVDSYASSDVQSDGPIAGGLVGWVLNATVDRSYASGAVSGTATVGGLAGIVALGGHITSSFSMPAALDGPEAEYMADVVASSVVDTHHWNGPPCGVSCQNSSLSQPHVFGTVDEAAAYFGDPEQAPLTGWDFEGSWMQQDGALPTLRMPGL